MIKKTKTKSKRTQPVAPAVDEPTAIAAIDVGATSIRMAVTQVRPDGTMDKLDELIHPVSLGSDTFRVGHITPRTMRAVCQVLKNFSEVLSQYDVKHVHAVATSAIRDATNQDVVLDRIRHESGITLHVLDAVEESRLTYQTILPFLRKHIRSKKKHSILLDLGGGSTEILVLRGHNLLFAGSRRLGMTRIFHTRGCDDCGDTQALLESVIHNVVASTEDLYRNYPIAECVVINPLLSEVLRREKGAKVFDTGMALTSDHVRALVEEAETLSSEARAERFGVGPTESELLLPALLIIGGFLNSIDVKRVYFVEIDTLSGVLGDVTMMMNGENPLESFQDQIIGSATGVAEKYHWDKKHSRQVRRLAGVLFNELADFFDLDGRDRLYLDTAAILHDIGMFVSEYAHHKHGAYLTRWSEIVGLSDEDREIIALIVRYHRKASPRSSHADFMALSAADRVRVMKLASLLRIADALDRRHAQDVGTLHVDMSDSALLLRAECVGDLSVEQAALADKGELFEQITGLNVKLMRHHTT